MSGCGAQTERPLSVLSHRSLSHRNPPLLPADGEVQAGPRCQREAHGVGRRPGLIYTLSLSPGSTPVQTAPGRRSLSPRHSQRAFSLLLPLRVRLEQLAPGSGAACRSWDFSLCFQYPQTSLGRLGVGVGGQPALKWMRI